MLISKHKRIHPLVSIITVNYNHSEVTCDLIESLNKITYPNIEIIVVDNDSPDDSPLDIKSRFPNVIMTASPINYGFAAGNNYGIMKARGKYVLLINNDTVVTKNFLEPLVDKMEADPTIGALSPKIRYFHTPDTIQYAGATAYNLRTMRNRAIGFGEVDKGQFEEDRETAYAHGAAMMIPIDVIKKIGMMSYAYFLYYEEADWCYRIRKAGYKIFYVHNSLIFHKESIATGKQSPLKIFYQTRNRIVFLRRNVQGKEFYISIIYMILIAIPKNTISFILKRRFDLLKAFYKGIFWNINNISSKEIFENPVL